MTRRLVPFRNLSRALSLAGAIVLAMTSAGCVAAFVPRDAGPSGAELDQLTDETAPYLVKGSGSISGIVTVDFGGRQIAAPATTQVYLTPATTFASQRLQEYVIEKNELPEKRGSQLVELTRTDANGRFRFQGLAAGDYIVASEFGWVPPGSSEGRAGVAYARVRVGEGAAVTVNVTRQITEP